MAQPPVALSSIKAVNVQQLDWQDNATVITLADGRQLAAWNDKSRGVVPEPDKFDHVRARFLDATGAPAADQPDFALGPAWAKYLQHPALAPLPDGGFAFAWVETSSSMWGKIYLQRYDADAQPQEDATFLAGSSVFPNRYDRSTNSDFPVVRVHDDGSFAVAYIQNTSKTGWPAYSAEFGVRLHRFDAAGNQIGSGIDLIPPDQQRTDYLSNLDMAVLTDGRMVLVWQDDVVQTPGDGGGSIRARIIRADGTPEPGGHIEVTGDMVGGQTDPRVAPLPDGSFLVTWNNRDPGLDVRGRVFSPDRTNPIFEVPAGLAGDQSDSAIAVLPDGRYAVFWVDSSDQISGRVFLPGGVAVGDTWQVRATEDFVVARGPLAWNPEAAVDAAGNITLTWTSDDPALPAEYAYEIFSRVLTPSFMGTMRDGTLWGGAGPDYLPGSAGNDRSNGQGGNDVLRGEGGNDTLIGGDGNDVVTGHSGNDVMSGDAGFDTLNGGDGSDTIYGGPGNDVIWGGLSPDDLGDSLFGGDGNDRIEAGAGIDTVFGGGGNDTLLGGTGHDGLSGGAGDDIVNGNDGNDILQGEAGNDRLSGDAGNDRLNGGDGSDTLHGGPGDDTIWGGLSPDDLRDLIFGGDGNDRIDSGAGNDEVYGGNGNDTIEGGAGADTILGQDGNDVLTGSAFSDLVFGGAGDDFLNGGFGSDAINGGAGSDRFFHGGVLGHGSDWIQDYTALDGDLLVFGGEVSGTAAAKRALFQVNVANTPNAGAADVAEAFVIWRPTGQILWALVDGDAQTAINLQVGGQVFDLLA